MRGNPDNPRQAARKSAAAQARAEHGLREMIRANQPITFRGLAQTAGVSLDFLYRCAPIRQRVEHLRAQQHNTPPPVPATTSQDAPSSVVRTLTAQLSALKQRHRDEVHQLRQALEAAQGEILDLRRRLGHRRDIEPPHPGTDGHPSSSPTAAPHALDATDVQTVNRSLADASAKGRPAQTRE